MVNSLLCRADSMNNRLLYTVMPLDWVIPNKTMFDLLMPMYWGFVAGARGSWPHEDHLANPLPGPYLDFTPTQLTGWMWNCELKCLDSEFAVPISIALILNQQLSSMPRFKYEAPNFPSLSLY